MERFILFMDSDIPSIYFPAGLPSEGGSCEFATKTCLQYCPSGGVENGHEQYAFNYFLNNSANVIFEKIIRDYGILANKDYNAKMIQWFCWGDCPSSIVDKVTEIIIKIYEEGIPQYGYTRNKLLWENVPSYDRLHIGLTIEDVNEALKVSKESGKMTASPDYDSGYAIFIYNGEIASRCSGWWCISKHETRNSDCNKCLAFGEGCYSR